MNTVRPLNRPTAVSIAVQCSALNNNACKLIVHWQNGVRQQYVKLGFPGSSQAVLEVPKTAVAFTFDTVLYDQLTPFSH